MKVKANDNFSTLFGADDFIKNWPELLSTGIEVRKCGDLYYIIEIDKVLHNSAFFTTREFNECLTILD